MTKKVHEVTEGNRTVKVHSLPETNEYRARLYIDGKAYEPADYFSSGRTPDDLVDAIATADMMVKPPKEIPTAIDVKIEDVKVGDVLWQEGVKWNVTENIYDPKGNTGNQKRHLLTLKLVEGEKLPDYMRGCENGWGIGRLVGVNVSIIVKAN